MFPRRRTCTLAALAFVTTHLLAAAAHAQQAGSYTLDGDSVAIYDLVGEVTVEPAGSGPVTVEVRPGGADAARLQVRTGPMRGRATLRVVYPSDEIRYAALGRGSRSEFRMRDDGTWDGNGRGGRRVTVAGDAGVDAHADLRIRVPEGRTVAVYVGAGAMTARNVRGMLRLDGASADVAAQGIRGDLTIDVGSGTVRASDVEGDLSIDTGSGDVTVDGVTGRDVTLDTGSGDVRVHGARATTLRIDTGSGDVTLRAPNGLDARIHLESSSGDIDSDLAIQDVRRDEGELDGRIGAGSGRIRLETSSGTISLLRR